MPDTREVSLAEKVEFLRRPERYPDAPTAIEAVETHFAWIFLSSELAYKLKKPIRFRDLDMSSLAARKLDCDLELDLNRRLAERTYLGVVPLTRTRSELCLEGGGTPVEWLVKMRRLPAERNLVAAARDRRVSTSDLRRLIAKLSRFYASAARAPWPPTDYPAKLRARCFEHARQLRAAELRLDASAVDAVASAQCRFIDRHAELLEARIEQGRIVDAHGDLRPEHVFLVEDPQIIDCLEFDAELRLLDSAAEIAFLGLECERLGHPALGGTIVRLYLGTADDPIRTQLLDFYRSMAAVVRALTSAWHLPDVTARDAGRWMRRAAWYLGTAQAAVGNALA